MKKGTAARDLLMIPLTVPLALLVFFLLLVAGFEHLFDFAASLSWPTRDVVPIYLVEIPLVIAAVWRPKRELLRPRLLVGLAIWLCMNALLYLVIGGFHP